jgi:NADPH:quinone reductase-like Zn-dependent oxidoreductase
VIPLHDQAAITGRESVLKGKNIFEQVHGSMLTYVLGLGQQVDGTLAEYVVLPEHTLVKVPSHLSWEEVL